MKIEAFLVSEIRNLKFQILHILSSVLSCQLSHNVCKHWRGFPTSSWGILRAGLSSVTSLGRQLQIEAPYHKQQKMEHGTVESSPTLVSLFPHLSSLNPQCLD